MKFYFFKDYLGVCFIYSLFTFKSLKFLHQLTLININKLYLLGEENSKNKQKYL